MFWQSEHKYPAHRIYNVDRNGLTTVQSKSSEVLAFKDRREVESVASAERKVFFSLVVCIGTEDN